MMNLRMINKIPLVSTALSLPAVAEAAQPSFFYEAYASGVAQTVMNGVLLFGPLRISTGAWLHHSLEERLEKHNLDVEHFRETKPQIVFSVAAPLGVFALSSAAFQYYQSIGNFEMPTLVALTGAGLLAAESLWFLRRTGLAYWNSQREVVNQEKRDDVIAKLEPLVQARAQELREQIQKSENPRQREAYEAEIDWVLERNMNGVREAKYADEFLSYQNDLERYFEELQPLQEEREADSFAESQRRVSNWEVLE